MGPDGEMPAEPSERLLDQSDLVGGARRDGDRLETDFWVPKQQQQGEEVVGVLGFHVPNDVKHGDRLRRRLPVEMQDPDSPGSRAMLSFSDRSRQRFGLATQNGCPAFPLLVDSWGHVVKEASRKNR
jgi:hypothetical protein